MEEGNGDSMGGTEEVKWLATAWVHRHVHLGFTLRVARDQITRAGSPLLGVAECRAGLEAKGQGQDVAWP